MEDASLLHQVAKQERQIQELKSQKGILKDMHDVTKHKLAAVEISVKQAEAELETSDQEVQSYENSVGNLLDQKSEWSEGVQAIEEEIRTKENQVKICNAECQNFKQEFVIKMSGSFSVQRTRLAIATEGTPSTGIDLNKNYRKLGEKTKHLPDAQRLVLYITFLTNVLVPESASASPHPDQAM